MKQALGVFALVLALMLAMAGLAVAADDFPDEELEEGTEEEEAGDEIWFYLDEEAMQLIYWLPTGTEGEEPPECFAPDGGDEFPDADEADEAPEAPDDCRYVDVERNGKVTHGSVVSSFVHDLKEIYDKDTYGPFGLWVSQVARSDAGKPFPDMEDGDDVELADRSDDGEGKAKGEKRTPPGHEKAKSKRGG